MTRMPLTAFAAALGAVAFLSACAGGSSPVVETAARPIGAGSRALASPSFYACPARGSLKYVSDFNDNAIAIFAGNFDLQSPCGRLTSHLSSPWGMSVDPATHDLYVANYGHHDVIVFHRGQLTPYDTYVDPSGQDPVDVVLAGDGTVIASNQVREDLGEDGSLSTWVAGANGGTFVGNFAMAPGGVGQYVAVRNDGTVFFDKLNGNTFDGNVWTVSCPRGACETQTMVKRTFGGPAGLSVDSDGDLRIVETSAGLADTFEFPRTHSKSFQVTGAPTGIAVNESEHHLFVADGFNNGAEEYVYPGGSYVGFVSSGDPGGATFGVAVDPNGTR